MKPTLIAFVPKNLGGSKPSSGQLRPREAALLRGMRVDVVYHRLKHQLLWVSPVCNASS
jgi:hypothetical protein